MSANSSPAMSGDLHGANLVRQLIASDPSIECVGYGGPKMEAAGCRLHADLTKLAVMWFARALASIHTFWGLLSRADRYFQHHKPDAVVLIDYPGFNWWIARRAKAHGIPVFYYGVPQLWAWASWRVKKMRRLVDHALCKLPFEEDWYRAHGCRTTYVGHPYFDELRSQQIDQDFLDRLSLDDRPVVTILPGSRTQEVTSNLAVFLNAAKKIQKRVPSVRFLVASFTASQAEFAQRMIAPSRLPAKVFFGRTPELIHAATCCVAVSGSVSLELLYHAKPSVICYKVSALAYSAEAFFRRVKYITLVNLLAASQEPDSDVLGARPHRRGFGQRWLRWPFTRAGHYDANDAADAVAPMPEYLTYEDKSQQIAEHISEWLTDEPTRLKRVQQLEDLGATVDQGGASERAAGYILGALRRPVLAPRPHASRPAA